MFTIEMLEWFSEMLVADQTDIMQRGELRQSIINGLRRLYLTSKITTKGDIQDWLNFNPSVTNAAYLRKI